MTPDATGVASGLAAQLAAAWNAADGAAYGRAFTEDASFVDIRGGLHRSAAAIGAGHQAIFASIYRDSHLTAEILSARAAGPGVVAQIRFVLDAPHGGLPPNDGSIATLLAVEDGGDWRIAAFQNTLRLAAATPSARA